MDFPLNLARIYDYRFKGVDQQQREAVWAEISAHIVALMGGPERLLDPAGGRGEFINTARAPERWFVDMVPPPQMDPRVKVVLGNVLEIELPPSYFGGIFVSNFLEHLDSPGSIATFLGRMFAALEPGGRLVVLGPNFRYCAKDYYDCADHQVALTHLAVAEHVYGVGFEVERVTSRFLPFSFRGLLPPSRRLTAAYLRMPIAWRILGKQFLVVGRKPTG